MKMYSSNETHILVFPYPAQGHMLALVDLTHRLSLRGLTITVLLTPKNLPILAPLLSAHPGIQTLLLPFPPHRNLPAGVENVRDIGNSGNIPIMNALAGLRGPILRWFESHPDPPSAMISDFFLGWTVDLARDLNIPRIAFFSVSALLAPLFDRLWGGGPLDFSDLPGSPEFEYDHLPSLFRRCREEASPETEFVGQCILANRSSWGRVFNTFDALEPDCLAFLRGEEAGGRVYGVGPLSLLGVGESGPDRLGWARVEAWLDACPDDSVLYVCFGSQKTLDGPRAWGLASGLELSGARFLWVVGPGGAVPEGFEERVGERGLVVEGWAPQVRILGHRAVGGFLSHCGWNSTLEAAAAGVRVIGWPMEADQYVNARLVTARVRDPDRIAEVIVETMREDSPEKTRAEEMREKALAAVREGGTSFDDLEELVRDLRGLPKPVAETNNIS